MAFLFPCGRRLKQQLGQLDAVCEVMELAARELVSSAASAGLSAHIRHLSACHGVHVNHVLLPQFNLHRIHLYVTSVQPSLEEFCTALRSEHPNGAEWDWSGDDDRLTKLTRSISFTRTLELEVCHYYRTFRNAVVHRNAKLPVGPDRLRGRVSRSPRVQHLAAPNPLDKASFDDFVLFTRCAKRVAEQLCRAARPTDEQLRAVAHEHAESSRNARRLLNNPRRLRSWRIEFLRATYSLSETEAASIVQSR